jgi:peptide/nickel transport system ATP-binding protein
MSSNNRPSLQIENAVKKFDIGEQGVWSRLRREKRRYIKAVDGVTLGVAKGETLVVLGESGCGKTTLGRLIVGLERLDSGRISYEGSEVKYVRDRGAVRGRLQMVFQDPSSSLNPYLSVSTCIAEPISKMGLRKSEVAAKVSETLKLVGMESLFMARRTSDLSGGQKQRTAIARALISDPAVIVHDEPTSSIDVSIQAQILNLLVELQSLRSLTYVLITHDPNVAKFMADKIAVMYLGKIVEYGMPCDVLKNPKHPYTQALLASAPKLDGSSPEAIGGEPPSLINLPKGCRFEPRCPHAMPKCREREPVLISKGDELVSCYLYEDS